MVSREITQLIGDPDKKLQGADRDFVVEFQRAMQIIRDQAPQALQKIEELLQRHAGSRPTEAEEPTHQDSNDLE